MLLLLKMNDCLRHIDMALESPTNTLVIAGKYASKAVYRHQIQRNKEKDKKGKRNGTRNTYQYIRTVVESERRNRERLLKPF